jgi:ABC-type nitrate/sulfonate/bicarbonate transport system substrate-binding protein
LSSETWSGSNGVQGAYRDDYHRSMHLDLSPERLGFLGVQKDFLYRHGFLDTDFDVAQWSDPAPLAEAHRINGSIGAR